MASMGANLELKERNKTAKIPMVKVKKERQSISDTTDLQDAPSPYESCSTCWFM